MEAWLHRAEEIVARGLDAYHSDGILQEAGDSLMMKLGESANRLARLGVVAPPGVDWALAIANRNFVVHQYDQINRSMTWATLATDLPRWRVALAPLIAAAAAEIRRTSG